MTVHRTLPLHRLAHARAGDKGNCLSIALIAFDAVHWPILVEQVTEERVARLFASRRPVAVRRHLLPRLHAMNFVIEGVLDGGVNGALNLDAHGKCLSSLLLELPVEVPEALVPGRIDYAAPGAFVAGDEGVYTLPAFRFDSGETLQDMRIGYVTHGRLNPARDNAVLLLPGTANTRHSADGYIGPGNALDPEHDFIIAVDAIGAGTSSQPADGFGGSFPAYGIRDMVRVQHALVTAYFGLSRLKAVVGASMGAFQALEWAIHYPDLPQSAVLLVPAARAGNVFRGVVDAALEVLRLDARWNDGAYTDNPVDGLRAAGRLYYPWTVTDDYIAQSPRDVLEREIGGTVERAAQWDAWNFVRRYQASAGHDVSVPFGGDLRAALSRVRARTLVMPTSTERLLGLQTARDIAAHVPCSQYVEVPSDRGHLGWRAVPGAPETQFIASHIRQFLTQGDNS